MWVKAKVAISAWLHLYTVALVSYSSHGKLQKCPIWIQNCECTVVKRTSLHQFNCTGDNLPQMVQNLPATTLRFIYNAREMNLELGKVDFKHLPKLESLSLRSAGGYDSRKNLIFTGNDYKVFKYLTMKSISWNIPWRPEGNLDSLFMLLPHLEKLDISRTQNVGIDKVRKSFIGFANNTVLSLLNLFHIQSLDSADTSVLDMNSFLKPLKHCPLKVINVGFNALTEIKPGLIKHAPNLTSFSASNNLIIHLFKSGNFMDIILHPSLKSVSFKYQGYGYIRNQHKTEFYSNSLYDPEIATNSSNGSWMEHNTKFENGQSVETSSITDIFDTGNINLLMTNQECVKNLKEYEFCSLFSKECEQIRVNLTSNHQLFCALLQHHDSLKNIPCEHIPLLEELIDENCAKCLVIPLKGSLQEALYNNLNIYDEVYFDPSFLKKTKCFHKANKLNKIDISCNRDRGFPDTAMAMQMDITGLQNLEEINATQIGLEHLNFKIGNNFPKLKKLYLAENGVSLKDEIYNTVFKDSQYLQKLILKQNRIDVIQPKTFVWLKNLRHLDLKQNQIESFDASLENLTNLEFIELSFNQLTQLPVSVIEDLENIINARKSGKKLYVDISYNDLICTCQNRDFVSWALNTKITFYNKKHTLCINSQSIRVELFSIRLEDIDKECRGELFYILLTIGITVPCSMLFFLAIVTIYRKRWWFRYQYFLAKRIWKNYKKTQDNNVYKYDAFISYNEKDKEWVEDKLKLELESKQDLKLCLHYRNFMPGDYIVEQIVKSIEESRKTLLVLSPHFLESTWCQYEMHMAQHKLFSENKDVLILVLLKPLPKVGVSKVLKSLLETKTYIEWTDDSDGQRLFWAKLLEVIKTPIAEPYDLSVQTKPALDVTFDPGHPIPDTIHTRTAMF